MEYQCGHLTQRGDHGAFELHDVARPGLHCELCQSLGKHTNPNLSIVPANASILLASRPPGLAGSHGLISCRDVVSLNQRQDVAVTLLSSTLAEFQDQVFSSIDMEWEGKAGRPHNIRRVPQVKGSELCQAGLSKSCCPGITASANRRAAVQLQNKVHSAVVLLDRQSLMISQHGLI